jgi:hypothetical protein
LQKIFVKSQSTLVAEQIPNASQEKSHRQVTNPPKQLHQGSAGHRTLWSAGAEATGVEVSWINHITGQFLYFTNGEMGFSKNRVSLNPLIIIFH